MKSIMELLYNELPGDWRSVTHKSDSEFVRTARIKSENLDMLMESLTEEQKEWFEGYSQADTKIEGMIHYDDFCYAFHFGAQLMAEMIRGKEKLLK